MPKNSKPKTTRELIKDATQLRNAAVQIVRQRGHWQKHGSARIPVMGVKDHHGLSIIFKTPFQQNWPAAPLKPRKGYYLQVKASRGHEVVFEVFWDRNAPIVIETYRPGLWERNLCPTPIPAIPTEQIPSQIAQQVAA